MLIRNIYFNLGALYSIHTTLCVMILSTYFYVEIWSRHTRQKHDIVNVRSELPKSGSCHILIYIPLFDTNFAFCDNSYMWIHISSIFLYFDKHSYCLENVRSTFLSYKTLRIDGIIFQLYASFEQYPCLNVSNT